MDSESHAAVASFVAAAMQMQKIMQRTLDMRQEVLTEHLEVLQKLQTYVLYGDLQAGRELVDIVNSEP